MATLTSCGVNNSETPASIVTSGFNSSNVTIAEAFSKDKPFSNPILMYGSDFLTMFKSFRKMGKFDDMIAFTSKSSIDVHGVDAIRNFYANKYKNMSNVKLKNTVNNSDGTITLFYTNINMATKNAINITVAIENDTAKIILPNKLTKILN